MPTCVHSKVSDQAGVVCMLSEMQDDARVDSWSLHHGDALDAYRAWPQPDLILSDGAYGLGGFKGDPQETDALPAWYAPHIEQWAELAAPSTTLWFWNTEVGWAAVHPILAAHGWEYVQLVVWDKGISHIAGNVNGETIRQFPVVTEICAFYRRTLLLDVPQGQVPAKDWLRREWQRSGLPLREANTACGVAAAAARKFLATDWQWYVPTPEMMQRLSDYANLHGDQAGAPYFCVTDGAPVSSEEWSVIAERHPWGHRHGLTNVWSVSPLHSSERYRAKQARGSAASQNSALHLNQKPTELMRRIIIAATQPGAVVWEPFGGLCSASVAAIETGRRAYAAEVDRGFSKVAAERLSAVTPMMF